MEKGFFDMMNTLLSPVMNIKKKKCILENEYQISMEMNYVEEVEKMCNLSEWVLEIGIEQGIEQGIERGIEQEKRSVVENLLREGASDQLIMKVTEITKEKLLQIKEEMLCLA